MSAPKSSVRLDAALHPALDKSGTGAFRDTLTFLLHFKFFAGYTAWDGIELQNLFPAILQVQDNEISPKPGKV